MAAPEPIHSSPHIFLEQLEQFLARKRWRIMSTLDSPVQETTHLYFRLIAFVKGKAEISYSRNHEIFRQSISPGTLMVTLPSGYLATHHEESPVWTFQCIFWDRFIRLLYGNREKFYWYHTFAPIRKSGRSCLQTLTQLAREDCPQPQTELLLRAIYNIIRDDLIADKPRPMTKGLETFYAVQEYLSQHFHSPMTNRQSVATALGLSPQHISRLFREFGDEGFNATLRRLRLELAGELLSQGGLNIGQVAERCGYASAGYFIKEFRKTRGVTPGLVMTGKEK